MDYAVTFADSFATRLCCEGTFEALRTGLADFLLAEEAEIAATLRLVPRTTHNLAESAAAVFAGLLQLRDRLAGRTVAVVLSGGNH